MFRIFIIMNSCFLFILMFISFIGNAICQDTLSVDWHRNVCSNNYIDHVFDIASDSNGNVYTLGAFPNSTNSLGQILNESTGSYFLNKLDSLGNLIYSINFGNQDYLTFGELELTNSNEIIIGVNFIGNFYYNSNIVTSNSNWSSLLMKLDSNLNLIWYEKIPCIKQTMSPTYLNALTQDENQNIYTSIQFIDSIEVNGLIYTNENGYGFLVSKFTSNGIVLWTRKYQSNQNLINRELKYFRKGDHIGKLILTGQNSGDSLFIDGSIHLIKQGLGTFVSKLDIYGNILESIHFKNVDYIIDFSFYNDRIFCAGIYRDSVFWSGNISIPIENKSAFICELNQFSVMIDFHDLITSKNLNLTDFAISELYGFVVSGFYNGGMTAQSSSITLDNQYNIGSIIASFDHDFILNDSKYITGGSYNLRKFSIKNEIIFGTGVFENYCDFQNIDIHASNDDISVFRTSDINKNLNFNSQASAQEISSNECNFLIYPNPTSDILQIQAESLIIINIISIDGRIMQDFFQENIESSTCIDLSKLKRGAYFINLLDCNGDLRSIRVEKIN
jgi:hypothetical protein